MAKIDFDSDNAPFSGAVLPTIEDVAALAHDDGREDISPKGRGDGGVSRKAQSILLPVNLILGLVALGFFHFFTKLSTDADSGRSKGVDFSEIPFDQARDVRFVEKAPKSETVEIANDLSKGDGKRIVFFYEKGQELPGNAQKKGSGVEFFGAEGGTLHSEGILLDGYRWFPLPP